MRKIGLLVIAILSFTITKAQYTVISDDSAYVPTSGNALLEVYSQNGNKGILVPRLTTAQRTALVTASPADNSLLVYDTDTKTFWYFDGTSWVEIIPGGTDDQLLTLSNDTLYIENGNGIYLGDFNQTLTFDDVTNQLTISNGNTVIIPDSVNDADSDPTNEIELPPTAVNGQVLTWDGSAWVAQNPGSGADNWGTQVVVSDATLSGDGTSGNPLIVNGDLTDDQTLNLTGNTLSISGGNSVDLSGYLDNTDDQNLTGATLTGTTLQIDIENGSSTSVDLSSLQDGTGTDDQNIQGSGLSGTTLTIGIENGTSETVNLSSLLGTDNQTLSLAGTNLSISNGNTVSLASFMDNTDNQTLSLASNTLSISGGNSVDLSSYGNDWKLTGNAGTVDVTNFLGTTDDVPLSFRVNNQKAGRIDNAKSNTFFGYQAGNVASGNNNTLIGMNSGINQTTATENTFIGNRTGYYLQTGSGNTAIGYNALYCYGGSGSGPRPGGIGNIAIGKWAMFNPYSGDYNVAVGFSAYSLPHTGSNNVFIGYYSDADGSTDPSNAMGLGAYSKADADNANAIGYRAYANTANTVIIGSINGVNNATVNTNVGIGTQTPSARLQIGGNGGFAIGDVQAISATHGQRRSIQITTDTSYGGTYNNHTGYLIYSTMPSGWGTAQLDICTSNNWGDYATGTPALRITQTAIYANGTVYSSDRRLKTDIKTISYGLNQVMKMKPLIYTKHIADSIVNGKPVLGQGFREVGFIAQDLYKVIPEVVHKPKNEATEMWGIDYAKIVPILTKAIQDQQKIIQDIKKENDELRITNKKILERLNKLENK